MILLSAVALVTALGCGRSGSPTPTPTATYPAPATTQVAGPTYSPEPSPLPTATPSVAPGQAVLTTISQSMATSPVPSPIVTPSPTPAASPTPSPTFAPTATTPSPEAATISVRPAQGEVGMGQTTKVDVVVQDAVNLYAVDIKLDFDPAIVQVQDANPNKAGVQIEPGTFLDAGKGWLFQNVANNDTGQVWFIVTLVNPAPAVSGTGTLFTVTFQGKAAGTSHLRLGDVQLISRIESNIGTITSVTHGGMVVVSP